MSDLQDKVVLVTGGASGIGKAVCECASAAGGALAIIGRNIKAAQAFADQLPSAKAYKADVTSLSEMHAVCDQVVDDFGRLDGAVNNAGMGGEQCALADASVENWSRVLDANLNGVFNSIKAELEHMLPNGGGAIVNMASLSSFLSAEKLPAYVASKHAVLGLTRSVAIDYAKQGIRCNAVAPSFIKTPLTLSGGAPDAFWTEIAALHPNGRLVTVDEVAEAVVFLLSDRSSGANGVMSVVDGGISVI